MAIINIILAGIGGQGTVLASRLLAKTAMAKGLHAATAETIGMAQRGGSVVGHLRIGDDIYAPLVPRWRSDLIIGFEPAETVRVLPYLKQGGTVIANTACQGGIADYDGKEQLAFLLGEITDLLLVDGRAICLDCGSPKVLNTALLGAAAAYGAFPFTLDELARSIEDTLPAKLVAINLQALQMGAATLKR